MTAMESVDPQIEGSAESDEAHAFELAEQAQRKRELGADFAKKCLNAAVGAIAGLLICLVVIGWLGWRLLEKEVSYFTTEKGRITAVYPLDQPAWSAVDVIAFGADTIREAFTLDFVHYQAQMSRAQLRFDDKGYADYYKALISSNLWTAIQKQRMNLSTSVEPGVVTKKGELGGLYAYEVQYPVSFKLDGQQTSNTAQQYILTLRIQQVDPRKKPQGLEVTQVITSTR